jgi:hypothetical protein
VIGKLLGHTQVTTTERYAHLAADPIKNAADHVSSAIAKLILRDSEERPAGCWARTSAFVGRVAGMSVTGHSQELPVHRGKRPEASADRSQGLASAAAGACTTRFMEGGALW